MRKFIFLIFPLGFTISLLISLSYALEATSTCGNEYAPGLLLVKFKDGRTNSNGHHESQEMGRIPEINISVVKVPVGSECAFLDYYRRDPRIEYVELDYAAHALESFDLTTSTTPNDPDWDHQWSLEKINIPQAWNLVTNTNGPIIAILDSGIQLDHPDLNSQLWINLGEIPGNGIDDDGNGKTDDLNGWHFYHVWNGDTFVPDENNNLEDDIGHGTHIAGIAASATNNSVGIAGISYNSPVMTVKVLDQFGTGWYSDIAAGIIYAADNGAQIINLSLGGSSPSQTLSDAIDYARLQGSILVAATGNDSGEVLFPAAYEPVLAVGATDKNNQRASFSNYGQQVDLSAPGTDIYSTWYQGNYIYKSGTSMAAPHVSGVSAILWTQYPELNANEVVSTLLVTSKDIDLPGFDIYTGWGLVDAYHAIAHQQSLPDVWVKKSAPPQANPGDVITYTLTYGNLSDHKATGVYITDTLPLHVITDYQTNWFIDTLPPNSGPYTITLPVTVTEPSNILTNIVAISSDMTDAYPLDNIASVSTVIHRPIYFPIVFSSMATFHAVDNSLK